MRPPARAVQRLISMVILGLLASCASVGPRPLPPKVEVEGVRMIAVTPSDTRMRVVLNVHNPNAYPIPVHTLEARMAIEGRLVATAVLPSPVTLDADGDTRVEVETRPDFGALRGALDRVLRAFVAHYEISGFAIVGNGTRLDFSRRGELPLADLLGRVHG